MRTPSSQKCRLNLAPPLADRFILGVTPSITARYFSSCPSDSTSRWTPCPPGPTSGGFRSALLCFRLSPSCPFRLLHTYLSPGQRGITPAFGYSAPHSSARGTSTLLNYALLSAPRWVCPTSPAAPAAFSRATTRKDSGACGDASRQRSG